MPATSILPPFAQFTDRSGEPLDNGSIYIGSPGLEAQTNPIVAYWDDAFSVPAAQPIRTLGGYPVYNGTPARVYVPTDFSITVVDNDGAFVYSSLTGAFAGGGSGLSAFYADRYTATAGQTTFTLTTNPASINALDVSVNGSTLVPGDDFTWVSTTVTLTAPMVGGERVLIRYTASAGTATVLAGSVTDVSVATGSKLYNRINDWVSVKDFGAVGDGTTDDTAAINAAIAACPAGGTVLIPDQCAVTGCSISNKSDITITGAGGLTLVSAASGAGCLQLVGTVSNVHIVGLKLRGEANTAYSQYGIGCSSGQTVSKLWVVDCDIADLNVGVTLNAESSGTFADSVVSRNNISNIVGTASGKGYGVHLANATGCRVTENRIDACQRHSIYQAKGSNLGNVIAENVITNHRNGVATAAFLPAITVARGGGVIVANNTIKDYYDGAILVTQVTADALGVENVDVFGNMLVNRKNAVVAIAVGEQAVPTSYYAKHIRIFDNKLIEDAATSGGGSGIIVHNGVNVQVRGNALQRSGVTGTSIFAVLGHNSYVTADADCTACEVSDNSAYFEGSTLTATSVVSIATDVATNTSVHRVANNGGTNVADAVRHDVTPTNPNLTVLGVRRAAIVGATASTGAGSTAGYARTNATVRYISGNALTSKASTDNLWNLTAVTTGAAEYRKVLLCLDGSGNGRIVVGNVAASQAAALIPAIPDDLWAPIGVAELGTSYSGGALATVYDVSGTVQ